eukprot:4808437-Pleurochrysis_carterae.AAC.1
MESCVLGGWPKNRSLNLGDNGFIRASLAISCVALAVGAPKTHWSKKILPTPFVAASSARSLCVDMSTCSLFPSMAKREFAPRDTGDSNTKSPLLS